MKKYYTIAVATLALASCSSNEDLNIGNAKDSLITVTAGVDGMNTRAGYDSNNLPANFYLTITQEDGDSKYNYTDVKMTEGDGNNYSPETSGLSLLWKDNSHSANAISAYTIEGTNFTVQTDQSTADKVVDSDLLGAIKATENSDITITGNNIGITFRHLLCKLDVTYTWGTELGSATKSIGGVVYKDFGTDVTLDRTNCTIGTETAKQATGDIQAHTTTADEGVTYHSEAIFAPYVGSTPKIVITTTIGSETRVFSLIVTAPDGGFVAGKRYTMNVAIGGTVVEGGSVTATVANGWGNPISGNMETK